MKMSYVIVSCKLHIKIETEYNEYHEHKMSY